MRWHGAAGNDKKGTSVVIEKFGSRLFLGLSVALLTSGLAVTGAAAKEVYNLKMATFTPEPAPDSAGL